MKSMMYNAEQFGQCCDNVRVSQLFPLHTNLEKQ